MIGEHKVSEVISRLEDVFEKYEFSRINFVNRTNSHPGIIFTLKGSEEIVFTIWKQREDETYYYLFIETEADPIGDVPKEIQFDDGFESLDDLMLYLAHVYA